MKSSFIRRGSAVPLALAVALSLISPLARPVAALAQSDEAAPGGVARISAVDGNVAIQRGDANTAVDAVVNAPVLPADYVNTGDNARAEVEFDPGTLVRLGGNVQMRLSRIDPGSRDIQLAEGTINVRLLHGPDGQTTIDTPSVSILPRTSGSYRITVTHDGQTEVTVRSGHADIQTPDGAQPLDPGATLIAQGPATEPNIQSVAEVASDDFDAFNASRDQVYEHVTAAAPYVNPNVPGVEDLPSYGHWSTDPNYGNVWVPNAEPSTWAPYQNGTWAWEDYYGWTWVAAEPWGWAPYHYGRWFHSPQLGWAWSPPAVGVAVPAWSPALVGFVGFGATIGAVNIGLGFGFGNIGWVPLAPNEAFHPWWGPNARFVNVANINVNIGRVYRNAAFNYGMTSVSSQRWMAGDFSHRMPMTVASMRDVPFGAVRGGLPVVPSAANLRFSNHAAPQQLAYHSTQTFAGHATIPQRTPFETSRQTLARSYHTSAPVEHFGATSSERFAPGQASGAGRFESGANRSTDFAPRGGGAADSWSHFNTNRGTSFGRPAGSYEARPQTESRPSYSGGSGYSRPAYTGGAGYSRSAASQTESRPSYSRPSYNGGGGGYSRPQAQSAPSYSRPSYNGGGYSRPSYNGGGGQPRGPASYSRPSGGGGGAAPARQAAPARGAPSGGGGRNANDGGRDHRGQ